MVVTNLDIINYCVPPRIKKYIYIAILCVKYNLSQIFSCEFFPLSDWTPISLPLGEKKKRRAPPTRWFPPAFVQVVNKMANKLSGQWGGWRKSIDAFVARGGKRNFIIAFVMRFLLYCLQAIVRLEVYREWNGQRVQCRRLFAIYVYNTRGISYLMREEYLFFAHWQTILFLCPR